MGTLKIRKGDLIRCVYVYDFYNNLIKVNKIYVVQKTRIKKQKILGDNVTSCRFFILNENKEEVSFDAIKLTIHSAYISFKKINKRTLILEKYA